MQSTETRERLPGSKTYAITISRAVVSRFEDIKGVQGVNRCNIGRNFLYKANENDFSEVIQKVY